MYSIAGAADALADSVTGLEEVMVSLAKSKTWGIISRMSSGIFSKFWAIQNKFRAITIMFQQYFEHNRKQTKEQLKAMAAATKLSKLYKAMPKGLVEGNLPTNKKAVKKLYKQGKDVEEFAMIDEYVRNAIANDPDLKNLTEKEKQLRVLSEMRDMMKPQLEELEEQKKILEEQYSRKGKTRREKHQMSMAKRMKGFKEYFTKGKFKENMKSLGKMALSFLKFVLLFTVIATIVSMILRNAWPALKTWAGLMIDLLKGVWFFVKMAGEGLFMLLEGIFEGNLEMILVGLVKFLGGLFLAGFMLVVTVIGGTLALVGALIGGPIVEFLRSIQENGLASMNTFKAAVRMISQVVMIVAGIGALIAYFASGGFIISVAAWLGIAIAGAIGSMLTKRATGGIVKENMTLVGERGPELVSLPMGSRVHTNAESRRMGGNTINVHVNGRVGASDAEIRDIADKVGREINLRMNRTANSQVRF